ncbi:MAG: hypothetical protein QMD11_01495 [Smithella sp.]|nr:hypothetical protein [Smithella sp.]
MNCPVFFGLVPMGIWLRYCGTIVKPGGKRRKQTSTQISGEADLLDSKTIRLDGAIYGGEMMAHHYFRDFAYCDSGMIPRLLVAELISISGKCLSSMVAERMAAYPCSGAINYRVDYVDTTMASVFAHYNLQAPNIVY